MDIKRMICKSCGGVLTDISTWNVSRWRCEYCGAEYIVEGAPAHSNFVEVVPARYEVLRARVVVDTKAFMDVPPAVLETHVKRLLADDLAREIIDVADIKARYYISGEKEVTASVRIVKRRDDGRIYQQRGIAGVVQGDSQKGNNLAR